MSDLISRADAIEAVMAEGRKVYTSEYANAERIIYEADAVEALAMLPLADAVHGEWIKKQVFNPELDKYVPLIECSVCGYEPYFGGSESKFNYCANCGARMKGGGTE